MKKTYWFLTSLLALCSLMFVACGGGDDDPTAPTPTPSPTTVSKIEIPATENTKPLLSQKDGSVTLTFTSSGSWTASSSSSWCSVSPSSGLAGTVTVTFTASENDTTEDRTATITLKTGNATQTVTVTQVQKDAIVLAAMEYGLAYNETALSFDVQTNVSLSVTIGDDAKGWISQANTRALHSETLSFKIEENKDTKARSGTIIITGGDVTQTIAVKQDYDIVAVERIALMALYNATDGKNWKNKVNWGSDKPLGTWYGIETDADGHVTGIKLYDNNLKGSLPKEIGNFTKLELLHIHDVSKLTGSIPESIGDLKNLKELWIADTGISGNIPKTIGNLSSLQVLYLIRNKLSGSIPKSIGNLTNLVDLDLSENPLSGSLPETLGDLKNLENLRISETNISGTIPESIGYLSKLGYIHLAWNQLEGTIPKSFANLKSVYYINLSDNRMSGEISEVILKSGILDHLDYFYYQQQNGYYLTFEATYSSTDFSQHGKVTMLNKHSKGKGVPLVITGEAYSDRMIADGTFASDAKEAMGYFFSVEPYTTFKDYFDVYMVGAVSVNEVPDEDTAFGTPHNGRHYDADSDKVREFLSKYISAFKSGTGNVTVVVMVPGLISEGQEYNNMFDDGFSVGIWPVKNGSESLLHEVGGHGFGRLADEYFYTDGTTFDSSNKNYIDDCHKNAMFINVDYQNDPNQVIWKDFISNPDYKIEDIGVYEGGFVCQYGIYRPSPNSIMNQRSEGPRVNEFNAPSRWAIYQRIMKLAGQSYTFDDFLKYDKKNLQRFAGK